MAARLGPDALGRPAAVRALYRDDRLGAAAARSGGVDSGRGYRRGVAPAPVPRCTGARVAGRAADRVFRRAGGAIDRRLSLARRRARAGPSAAGRDALRARGRQPAAQPAAAAERSARPDRSITDLADLDQRRRAGARRTALDRRGLSCLGAHRSQEPALDVSGASRQHRSAGQPLCARTATGRRPAHLQGVDLPVGDLRRGFAVFRRGAAAAARGERAVPSGSHAVARR